jgi:hypothetical protein
MAKRIKVGCKVSVGFTTYERGRKAEYTFKVFTVTQIIPKGTPYKCAQYVLCDGRQVSRQAISSVVE